MHIKKLIFFNYANKISFSPNVANNELLYCSSVIVMLKRKYLYSRPAVANGAIWPVLTTHSREAY